MNVTDLPVEVFLKWLAGLHKEVVDGCEIIVSFRLGNSKLLYFVHSDVAKYLKTSKETIGILINKLLAEGYIIQYGLFGVQARNYYTLTTKGLEALGEPKPIVFPPEYNKLVR